MIGDDHEVDWVPRAALGALRTVRYARARNCGAGPTPLMIAVEGHQHEA